jgi:hypothetical protein
MKLKYMLLLVIALLGAAGWGPFSFFTTPINSQTSAQTSISPDWVGQESRAINAQANNIDPSVLKLSLNAYVNARHRGLDNKQLLTIIDYSKPSTERRLWVVDLKSSKVLFNTWVSHGKNSGSLMATSFSNQPGSLKSSIGVFLTEQPYIGGKGLSLRLNGLERGVNDNAFKRDIVVHGAWYVRPDTIQQYGQVGRSWGCPAVSPETAVPLINTIKNNTLVVVYYPDQKWLKTSPFLATG